LDGALGSNALAGATQPERAFVFLGRGGEGAAPYSVESERLEPRREGGDPMRRTRRMRRSTLLLALTFAVEWYVAPLPLAAEDQPKPAVKVLLEKVVEVPSKIKVLVRHVTYPQGYKTPEHTHKGPGPRYILQGKVKVMEGGEMGTYSAGEVFWESGIAMTAENIGDGEYKAVIVELLPVE
jgi:quercetin dioxygenase-like cupin family protein